MKKIRKGTTFETWFGKDSPIKVYIDGKQLESKTDKQLVVKIEKDFDLSER